MKNFQKLFLGASALVLGLGMTSCKKDKQITVTGLVADASGTALADVMVTSDGSIIDTVTTDASGMYSINVAKNGILKAEKTGYTTLTQDVEGNKEIDLTMSLSAFASYFTAAGNTVVDPAFASGSIVPTGSLPTATTPNDAWFTSTTYVGAVNPSGTAWYSGWSFYDNLVAGTNTSDALTIMPTKTIDDTWMQNAGTTVNLTNDTTYVLDGFVFVNSGQTLNIEAGTIIQGRAGTGANASALVIARGGMINATGTATEPIIFTYEGDNGNSSATTRGQWGGLIILGSATLNSSPGTTQIEGIPTTETRGNYGGTTDTDNSGTLQYVSIRHGGSNIGADNEINGLTLGGVGSGTTIEHVEVIGNNDDGIEWFGGTVNAKWLISAFCADDALDYDEGYLGKNQFVIVHQAGDDADRGGEHDGGTDPETGTPYAQPVFYNATFVGNSSSRALTFRDNAGGEYHNSIFTDFSKGVDIEDLSGQDQDSYKQWEDGNLTLENNVFYNIGAGTTGADLFIVNVQ